MNKKWRTNSKSAPCFPYRNVSIPGLSHLNEILLFREPVWGCSATFRTNPRFFFSNSASDYLPVYIDSLFEITRYKLFFRHWHMLQVGWFKSPGSWRTSYIVSFLTYFCTGLLISFPTRYSKPILLVSKCPKIAFKVALQMWKCSLLIAVGMIYCMNLGQDV